MESAVLFAGKEDRKLELRVCKRCGREFRPVKLSDQWCHRKACVRGPQK